MAGAVLARILNVQNSLDRERRRSLENEKVGIHTVISGGITALYRGIPHAPAHPVPQNAARKGDMVETECRLE